MEKFDLDEQYDLYLQLMRLDEKTMPEIQKIETRRAFYGGVAQGLVLQMTIDKLPEGEAFKKQKYLVDQVAAFWAAEGVKFLAFNK